MDRVVIAVLFSMLSLPALAQTERHENWDVAPVVKLLPGLNPTELSVIGMGFCAPVNLMIATAIVGELRLSEAHEIVAGCVLPVIGPAIVRRLYREHPEWNDLPTGPLYTKDYQMQIW